MPDPAASETAPKTTETVAADPASTPPAQPPKVEEPSRPNDVSLWKGDDFAKAKIARDPRLTAAVEHIGKKYPTSESAAKALTALIQDEELPIPGMEGKTELVQVNAITAAAILEALSKNTTPAPVETFRQLISGQMRILFMDRQLSSNVLPLLAKRQNKAFDDLLYEMATKPQTFRSKAKSRTDEAYTAEKLREDVIFAISSEGSPELRDRLAAFASDRTISSETAQSIESTITRVDLRNRLAQVTLLQGEHINKRTRQSLEGTVASNSARALGVLLGIPEKLHEPPQPGTVSRPSDKPKEETSDHRAEYLQLVGKLWTPEMNSYLEQRLQKEELNALPDVLLLLATFPLPSTRFTNSELLAINGYRGSQAWTAAGIMGRDTTDPGYIVLVKNLYHDRTAGRTTKVVRPEDGRTRVDDSAKKDWSLATKDLVETWMRRMYSAHQEKVDETGKKFTPDEASLPIKLHKDATIVAQYNVKWPDDVQAELPGIALAPLQVRYVRVENETNMDRVQRHYQHFAGKTKGGKTHDIKGGQWLDTLTNGKIAPNSLMSIDIRITSGGKQAGAIPNSANPKKDEVEWVVVEILTIEIPEPKNPDPRRKVE